MARRPKGYVGTRHETIGSDILAVLRSLQQLVGEDGAGARGFLPGQVLGAEAMARFGSITASGWYPIEWLLEMMETIDAKLGRNALRRMGRVLFKLSHQERVGQVARSARDIAYGIDGMYHHANRGEHIGGWKVLSFDASRAELEKTTPHHCGMEEGILSEALSTVGAPSLVSQRQCFRDGADACIFVINSTVSGPRWGA
jgi:hypothetical protein